MGGRREKVTGGRPVHGRKDRRGAVRTGKDGEKTADFAPGGVVPLVPRPVKRGGTTRGGLLHVRRKPVTVLAERRDGEGVIGERDPLDQQGRCERKPRQRLHPGQTP